MDKAISNNILRFCLLWLAQVFIFKQMYWGWGGQVYMQVHIFVFFIIMLPFSMPRSLIMLLAFIFGIGLDFFYESYGIHAASLVFTAYIRAFIFKIFTPREGYSIKDTPTKFSLGDLWFYRVVASLVLLHLFFYYSIEAFTYAYLGTILLKTFFSWLGSMFFILIIVYMTNPKV